MYRMFSRTSDFNQDNIESWDLSKVTNMYQMFYEASAFDQTLCFDTSSVLNTDKMFGCPNTRPASFKWKGCNSTDSFGRLAC